MQNSKLKKLTEQICIMEEKLQNAFNENAQLKVKQKEDEKLWGGLESKFSSTKTLCSQLSETLQQLNVQVQQGRFVLAYVIHFIRMLCCCTDISLPQLRKIRHFLEISCLQLQLLLISCMSI